MRTVELYLHYRTKQRELAASTQPSAQFQTAVAAAISEFEADVASLDRSGQARLCQDLGTQLEQGLAYGGDDRSREVLTRFLKAVEDIEYRHGLR